MPKPILTERTELAGVPLLHVRASGLEGPAPTVIWYHGWSSRKENHVVTAESLAVDGLRVLVPDVARHGERDPFPDYDALEALTYYWQVVEDAIAEAGVLMRAAEAHGLAIPGRIGVGGNSMGGMIAAGALARFPQLAAAVLCNSCPTLAWQADRFREARGFPLLSDEEREPFLQFDPEALLALVAPRPILMLHGDADTTVPIAGARRFLELAQPFYADAPQRLALVETPRLNHHVTVDQVLAARSWYVRYL